jgi:hypothetical protein
LAEVSIVKTVSVAMGLFNKFLMLLTLSLPPRCLVRAVAVLRPSPTVLKTLSFAIST